MGISKMVILKMYAKKSQKMAKTQKSYAVVNTLPAIDSVVYGC